MAGVPEEDVGVSESPSMAAATENKPNEEEEKKKPKEDKKKKQQKGFISRIWNGLFGSRKDDFERRLERISKEEGAVLSRIRRRSQSWGRIKRHLILFSVILEFVAVGFALLTARSAENWQARAFRILPIFLVPVLSSVIYSAVVSFVKMCDRKDQKTLEKLRAERQSKIDELKERTNYYITQQLIQRYDTDPAAKAAAAAVLASKLGADSGLKVYLGDESNLNPPDGKSNDVELVQSTGLRNRKQVQSCRPSNPGSPVMAHSDETMSQHMGPEQAGPEQAGHDQPLFVDHYQSQGPATYNSGWLARIAALLVGEDPTQCYALICGNCHMHNGLATKEDFPFVTYICPHCHAMNGPRHKTERSSGSDTPNMASSVTAATTTASSSAINSPRDQLIDNSNTHAAASATEGTEKPVAAPDDTS